MKGRKNGYAFYTEEVKKVNRLVLQGVVFLRILFLKCWDSEAWTVKGLILIIFFNGLKNRQRMS
ncbi:hypothetical protein HMPREF1987_01205 [Peptostreptococcaceae bacterium oral taxon 113 str. W5053]|nr:hypothetical protein HMPREF1987_01205 [Peptostreptococcaceae bacterium oral taxon 113 str. W5053]